MTEWQAVFVLFAVLAAVGVPLEVLARRSERRHRQALADRAFARSLRFSDPSDPGD
jgi:hypothetical protein